MMFPGKYVGKVEVAPTGVRIVTGRGGIGGVVTGRRMWDLGVPSNVASAGHTRVRGPLSEQEQQDAVYAATALRLPPGSEARAIQIGRTWRNMISENPWLQDESDQHFRQILQLSEVQQIADIVNSAPNVQIPVGEEFLRAAYELLQDYEYRLSTHQQALDEADQVRRFGTLRIRDLDVDVTPGGLRGPKRSGESPDTTLGLDEAEGLLAGQDWSSDAGILLSRIAGPNRGVDLAFIPDGRRLVWTAVYENGRRETILDAVLDEGVEIGSAEDAFVEGLLAWDGKGHTVVSKDDVRGRQTIVGALFGLGTEALAAVPFTATAFDLLRYPFDPEEGVSFSTRSDRARVNAEAQAEVQRRVADATDDLSAFDAIVAAAQVYRANGLAPHEAARQATSWGDGMTDEQFLAFVGDMQTDLTEQLENAADRRNSIRRGFDATLGTVAALLETYDALIHKGFMYGLATVEGVGGEIGIPGFRDVEAAWAEAAEAHRFGDYGFGVADVDVPDGWDAYANFFASVVADPFLWWTPGGYGLAQYWQRAMTSRAAAVEAMRQPQIRMQTVKIAEAVEADDLIAFLGRAGDMDPHIAGILVDPDARAAAASARGISEDEIVADVLLHSTPSFEGTNILDPFGHEVHRNSVEIVTNVGSRAAKSTRAERLLTNWAASFPRNRRIQLNGAFATEVQDTIMALFPRGVDKELGNKAVRDYLKTMSEYLRGGAGPEIQAIRSRMVGLRERMVQAVAETDELVRGFGPTKTRVLRGEQRLADIEVSLTGTVDDALRRALEQERDEILGGTAKAMGLSEEKAAVLANPDRVKAQGRSYADPLAEQQRADVLAAYDQRIAEIDTDLARINERALPMRQTDPLFTDLSNRNSLYNQEIGRLKAQYDHYLPKLMEAALPGNRDTLRSLMERIYYLKGEQLREKGLIKLVPGKHYPLNPDLPFHDWSMITGHQWDGLPEKIGVNLQESVSWQLYGKAPAELTAEEAAHIAQLEASGHLASPSSMPLPATPYEIAAYEGMGSPERWAKKMLGEESTRQRMWRAAQRNWAAVILWDAPKAVKSHFDELIGMSLRDGRWVRGRRNALVDIGGRFGDEPVRGVADAPMVYGARSMFTDSGIRPRSRRYSRMLEPPWTRRSSKSNYRVYQPGESGWVEAQRLQINGQFGEDRIIGKVGAALLEGNPDSFLRWWEAEGHIIARSPMWDDAGRTIPVTGEMAYRSRVQAFDQIASHAPGHEAEVRDALIRHAAGAGDLSDELLRRIKWPAVGPMVEGSPRTFSDRVFGWLYGGPGSRRGGAIHQDRWSEYFETLWTAKKNNGTLFDSGFVAEWAGVSQEEAFRLIAAMPEAAKSQVRASGMWFVDDLDAIAWNYARRYADRMMFQPGAASFLGKKFQPLSPFGPAQTDFITRTGMILTDAAAVGWRWGKNPRYLPMYPGAKKALPLNLRVMGEMASVAGAASTQIRKQQREEEQPQFTGPVSFLDRWTFYPLGFDRMIVTDLYPQLGGPLPIWAVNWLPVDADSDDSPATRALAWIRDTLEAASPSLTYNRDHYGEDGILAALQSSEAWGGLFDAFLPAGDATLRGQLQNVLAGVLAQISPHAALTLADTIAAGNDWTFFKRPLGFQRVFKNEVASWVAALPPGVLPIPGTAEYEAFQNESMLGTFRRTSDGELIQAATRYGAFWLERPDFDGDEVALWEGLVEYSGWLRQGGLIGDDTLLGLRALWDAATGESPTADAAEGFGDAARAVWVGLPREVQDQLIVEFPGLAMNSVQSYVAVTDASGEPLNLTYGRRGGRYDLPDGAEGRRVFKDGLDEGWLTYRPLGEIANAYLGRVAGAYSRVSSSLWSNTLMENGQTIGTQWRNPQSSTGEILVAQGKRDLQVVFSDADREAWAKVGIPVSDGMTVFDLAVAVQHRKESWQGFSIVPPSAVNPLAVLREKAATSGLVELAMFAEDLKRKWQDYQWLHDEDETAEGDEAEFSDWSPEDQSWAIRQWNYFIDQGALSQAEYNQVAASIYGDNRYVAPDPPDWSSLPDAAVKATPDSVTVYDGDTIHMTVGGEEMRVRLIGINAADYNSANPEQQRAAAEQADRLAAAIRNANVVQLANYDPERFGTTQVYADGGERLFFFLYLDGRPVWDVRLFSPENPAGRGISGDGIPEEWWVSDVS